MTDSVKWIVAGTAFALLGGAFFAGQQFSRSASRAEILSPMVAETNYPAPEVSIVAQVSKPRAAVTMLSRSSSQYSDATFSRRRRPKRKPKPEPKVEVKPEVDQEMGMMAADDQKLREAMEKADRAEQGDGNGDLPHVEPDRR